MDDKSGIKLQTFFRLPKFDLSVLQPLSQQMGHRTHQMEFDPKNSLLGVISTSKISYTLKVHVFNTIIYVEITLLA